MIKIELMAPAGSLDTLTKAIDAGADAVYLGLGAFNARINANNFTVFDLKQGCLYAHQRSSKVYLTLNTLINEYEMIDALATAVSAYEAGVDGFIVQDLGLAEQIAKQYPQFYLIASTQMNIYSSSEFKRLKAAGVSRVVLPRELSLAEIQERNRSAKRVGLDTEVFAHGAVCVCASGLCLFSSMNKSGSRSGNRGLCAQPCRQEYTLVSDDGIVKSGHLLSPKDRSIVPYLSDVIASGVSSLKIEGRMRDSNYVVATVKAYRKLIDAYYDQVLDNQLCDTVMNDLLVSFNRGGKFTSQYLSGKKSPDFLSGEYVGKYGLRLGFVSSTDSKKGTITFTFDESLPMPSKGDYISIRNKTTEICSFPIGKIHEMPSSLCVKGLHPQMIEKISGRPDVYLMSHPDFSIISKDEKKKSHINISVDARDPNVIRINAKINTGIIKETYADFEIPVDDAFSGQPLSFERATEQLKKTGETPFVVDEVFYVSNDSLNCRVSDINELRRGLMEALISEIDYVTEHSAVIGEYVPEKISFTPNSEATTLAMYYYPSIRLIEGDLLREDASFYAFSIYDLMDKGAMKRIKEFCSSNDIKVAIVFPDFHHDNIAKAAWDYVEQFKSFAGDAFFAIIDSLVFAERTKYQELGVKHFISAGANVMNSDSLAIAVNNSDGAYLSYELTFDEAYALIEKLGGVNNNEFSIFVQNEGDIPWMQSDFCPVGKHQSNCTMCLNQQKFKLEFENEIVCTIVSHRADCSSTLFGRAKNTLDDTQCEKLKSLGINVIKIRTML